MKGSIINCLEEYVVNNFGKESWGLVLEKSGFPKHSVFLSIQDIDDATVLKMFGVVCSVLNVSPAEASDGFGEFWMCSYAPRNYEIFFNGTPSARDFLLKMDKIHLVASASIPNAQPPRFEYSWENDKILVMKYKSSRNMLDFMVGLAKGVGKHFNENLAVSKIADDGVRIEFP